MKKAWDRTWRPQLSNKKPHWHRNVACLLGFLCAGTWFNVGLVMDSGLASPVEAISEAENKTVQDGIKSQQTIDRAADETKDMLSEYRAILEQSQNLRIYNEQLLVLTKSQTDELKNLTGKIESIQHTHRDVVPMMLNMMTALEQFVALDLPFLSEERAQRLTQLRTMMDRADISTSEKYRRILEAYQVENDYGRSIEAYSGEIEKDAIKHSVNFLRIGRIALLYQTLDGSLTFGWNREKKNWEELPSSYRTPVKDALMIARKQSAPDLMTLPIQAPMLGTMQAAATQDTTPSTPAKTTEENPGEVKP